MDTAGWYNGYSWKEREAKLREMKRMIAAGNFPAASGPCDLCGDPEVSVQYHDEDYSTPYLWTPPSMYKLCRGCHIDRLHKRFLRPDAWQAFLAHVRRGGYARDLKNPAIKKEVEGFRDLLKLGEKPQPRPLRLYSRVVGSEWFAQLSTDSASLIDPKSRPRP